MIPKHWIAAYLRFLLRHRLVVSLVVGLVTCFFAYQVTKVKVLPQFLDFYPGPASISVFGKEIQISEGHPYIRIYNEFRRMFGSANVFTAILEVKDGDIYNPTTLQKLDVMTKWVVESRGVVPYQITSIAHPAIKSIGIHQGGIQIRPVYFPGVPQTEEDAQRVKFSVYATKSIRGLYVSEDDTAALVHAGFWEEDLDFDYLHERMMELKEQVEDENHTVYFTGFPWLYASILRYMPEVSQVFVITFGTLCFLLWNYFRTWTGVWVPIFSGFLSSIWALGVVPMLGLNLDPLVLVVPIFLTARAAARRDRVDGRIGVAIGGHGGVGAEMVARAVPQPDVVGCRDGDQERALDRDLGAQQFAPDAHDRAERKIAGVAGRQAAQNKGFAAGPEIDMVVGTRLGRLDAQGQFGSAHDQVMHLVVDRVDLTTQVRQRFLSGAHGLRLSGCLKYPILIA
jgi:hypothetical protein